MNAPGTLEVICGPMFSCKTEELLRRLHRAELAHQKVLLFKPHRDTRYSVNEVVSHSNQRRAARVLSTIEDLNDAVPETVRVVGVDEVQFFEGPVVAQVMRLTRRGIRVIVAGLDLNFREEPFGPMPYLLAQATSVSKLTAVCVRCGADAQRSFRLDTSTAPILLGAKSCYEARCLRCFLEGAHSPLTSESLT